MRLQTKAVKTYEDGKPGGRPLSRPIEQAVNFDAESSVRLGKAFQSGGDRVYLRFGHPTSRAAAEKIAALEGAEAGLVFGSGMGAIATTLLALIGDAEGHVVAQRQIFAQTYSLLEETLRGFGVITAFVDVHDEQALRAAIRPNTRLLYIESPSNPLLRIVDIGRMAAIAKEHGILLVIDSTFATPVLQNPIELGADVVLHSATKFLGGHSDVMCGAVVASRDLVRTIQEMQMLLGTVLDPHAAWLLLRGIKTLGVRVERQCANALTLARLLERHDCVESVRYPWLESDGGYAVARTQMRGGGGVLTFTLKGGVEASHAFVDALRVISIATSLGGVETIIEVPSDLDFSEAEIGAAAVDTGIPIGLLRLSVGIEDPEDLAEDVRRGLDVVAERPESLQDSNRGAR